MQELFLFTSWFHDYTSGMIFSEPFLEWFGNRIAQTDEKCSISIEKPKLIELGTTIEDTAR